MAQKYYFSCVCLFQYASMSVHLCVCGMLHNTLHMAQGSPWRLVTCNQGLLFLASWGVEGGWKRSVGGVCYHFTYLLNQTAFQYFQAFSLF